MPVSAPLRRHTSFPSRPHDDHHHHHHGPRSRLAELDAREQPGAVAIPNVVAEPDEAACCELRGSIPTLLEMATDRDGSRRLQVLMDHAGPAERAMVFNEVLPMAATLMQHVFGNYVMQRVLHYGTEAQHAALVPLVTDNIIELSRNTFGCRVVQKALEAFGRTGQRPELSLLLQGCVVGLSGDQNGNHVLQRCIEVVPQSIPFIAGELRGSMVATSCQKYGCRVIQRLVGSVSVEASPHHCVLQAVVEEVTHHLQQLVTDQFGNYVVQAIMTCGHPAGLKPVYLLRGLYPILCRHKHASNVVETAFSVSPPSLRSALLDELCPFVVQLSGDPFGNFVVQKLFDQSTPAQQAALAAAIRGGAQMLKTSIHGRSVLGMLQRKEGSRQQQQQQQQQQPQQQQRQPAPQSQQPQLMLLQPAPIGMNGSLPQSMYAAQPPPPPPLQQQQQPEAPPVASMQVAQGMAQMNVLPSAPVTPLTPASSLSFTSTGDWTHNPNYGAWQEVEPQPPTVPETPAREAQPAAIEQGSPDNDLTVAYAYGY